MAGVVKDSFKQKARAALRDKHPDEFNVLRGEGKSFSVAMRILRDRRWDEYEDELKTLLIADSRPMVPAGRAKCVVCDGRLLDHRIGECRPQVYSWL